MQPEIRAGGGVLYRRSGSGPLFAVVHRPRYDDWTIPKGKVDEGEAVEAAALREVREETGWKAHLGPELGTVGYDVRGRRKIVRYWLMEAWEGTFAPSEEVDTLEWLDADAAAERVVYARGRNVVHWAARRLAGDDRGRIYLVRHGYAGQSNRWEGPDTERPVMGQGLAEVEATTALLTELPVSRVITSPFLRCVQSVEPLALRLGLHLETDRRLSDRAPLEPATRLLGELAGQAAVLCSHGDNILDLLGHAAAEGADLDAGVVAAKGSTWLLETEGRRVVAGRYFPPGVPTTE